MRPAAVLLSAVMIAGCGGVDFLVHDGVQSGAPLEPVVLEVGEHKPIVRQRHGMVAGGFQWGLAADDPAIVQVEYDGDTTIIAGLKPGITRVRYVNRLGDAATQAHARAFEVTVTGGTQAKAPFEPVDESAQDASFALFRAELLDAIERRDAAYLRSIIADDIHVSFGPESGIDGFERMWTLDDPDSEFWDELARVLRLGGAFRGPDRFWAPYVFANWPEDIDAFQHIAVTGRDVPAHTGPSSTAPVIARLTHEIVRLPAWNPTDGFHQIALADGTTAYVSEHQVRSPIDYRASFVRMQGRWILQVFIAGD